MYVANVLEDGFENNPLPGRGPGPGAARGRRGGAGVAPRSRKRWPSSRTPTAHEFLADMGLSEPGLNRVIRAGYKLLGMQTYFTAGVKEVRAWQVHKGSTAPQAAGGDPYRLREGLHPRRNHRVRRFHQVSRARRAPAKPAACAWKARNTWCRKATCCTSASTSDAKPALIRSLTNRRGRQNCRAHSGGIPKRPTGADCKSAGLRLRWFESTSLHQVLMLQSRQFQASKCGSSSMVEHQFSKLITRVRFPPPAPLSFTVSAASSFAHVASLTSSVGRALPW